jgi:hypothetical protein
LPPQARKIPEGWANWPKERKVRYFRQRKAALEAAKRRDPIAFYKPLPGALDFHRSMARNRTITGGNRAGKTEGGSAEDCFWLLGWSPYRPIPKGPLTGVISALSFQLFEQSLLEKLEELRPPGKIEIKYNRAGGGGTVKGPNGMAHIKSNESGWKSYQAMALDFAHLDEEHDYEVFKQLRKRLKAGRKLHLWMTMTAEPDRPDHWTYEHLVLPAQDPEKAADFAHFTMDLNDNRVSRGGYLADEDVDYIISVTPIEERPAVIEGKFVRRGGLMYPSWNRKEHIAPEKPLGEFLKGVQDGVYTPYAWLDWGVRNPTAMALVLEDKDGNCHVADEIYRPARDVLDIKREFNKRWGAFGVVFVAADPSIWHNHDSTDPTRTIAGQLESDSRKDGLRGLPLLKADNDEVNGTAAIRNLLKVDPKAGALLDVQPRCVKVIWEVENYVGQEWINQQDRNKKEKGIDKNNHHMDGLKYFALSPHGYIPPRRYKRTQPVRVNSVTGYIGAGA